MTTGCEECEFCDCIGTDLLQENAVMNHQVVTRTLLLRLVLVLTVMGGAIAALPHTNSWSTSSPTEYLAARQTLSLKLIVW